MSYWRQEKHGSFAPLGAPRRKVNVVVIGGGVTGITAAYLLGKAGRSVALLERGGMLARDTGHTTAHLTCVTDTLLSTLVERFGREHATAVWDAGLAALHAMHSHVRANGIPCDFAWVPGYLHAQSDDASEAARVEREATVAAELGFDATYVSHNPLTRTPAMAVADQARIDPLKYLRGLLRAAVERGCAVHEQSNVESIVDDPLAVVVNGVRLECDYVVMATHNPVTALAGRLGATVLQTKLALYSSYVVAGTAARGTVPDALFWDTADPYRYLRLTPTREGDLVIYGGADHKTGQRADTEASFAGLEQSLKALVPSVIPTYRWTGQVIETVDGLPYIGESAPRQFIATGFGGNGMTFGTIAGLMATDAVIGRQNPWSHLFDIGRTRVGSAWNYIAENKDYPYYMIRDRFAGAAKRSLRALRRGEGGVIDHDGQPVAAFRAEDGAVTLLSPTCTHMGCQVRWNTADRTWDCPCHGSRFAPDGAVLAGPAGTPLEPVHAQVRE
jgi:glycine/D-amino acid oxidase-like deaminating enzyme/nitrite reductase/ring-hydroxylating ferredoxin subunit